MNDSPLSDLEEILLNQRKLLREGDIESLIGTIPYLEKWLDKGLDGKYDSSSLYQILEILRRNHYLSKSVYESFLRTKRKIRSFDNSDPRLKTYSRQYNYFR